ncbi:MAG: OB-fold domain-containing protein [bacterium]|nr:OB-fold domain-containing protein [bacterium]
MISPIKLWRRQKYIPELLSQEGRVLFWTIVRTPPTGFKQFAPYVVALIELKSGVKMAGQLVDCDIVKLKSGVKVKAILRKVRESSKEGVIPYGIKFKLL